MPTPSKRSKAADQKTISIAEVKSDKELAKNLKADLNTWRSDIIGTLGRRGWNRLKESAKRAKMTPLAYFLTKIAPKL